LAVGSAGAVDEESALQSVHVHSAGGRQYELMSKQKSPLDGELLYSCVRAGFVFGYHGWPMGRNG